MIIPALAYEGIDKSYGKIRALRGVSAEALRGEIFGIVGPDGAGKTTMMRIAMGIIRADSGSVSIDGERDFRKKLPSVGYVPQRFSMYQNLTVMENILCFGALYGTESGALSSRAEELLRKTELWEFKDRLTGKLSGGMKQKLALCCALIHKPVALLLDEPTTGVDPVSRKEFWEMLKCLRQQNITIVVSTPYMDEATLCDRIALIQHGSLLSIDTPANIAARYPRKLYAVTSDSSYRLLEQLRRHPQVHSAYIFGDSVHVSTINDEPLILNPDMRGVESCQQIQACIEDCFIDMTQK